MEKKTNVNTIKKMSPNVHRFAEKGFTLVEIMVVVVIIALIALFAAPELMNFGPNVRLRTTAGSLHANLQKMKVEAIKRNREVVMDISILANNYKIFIDDDSNGVQNGTEEWLTFTDDSNDGSPDTDYDMPQNTTLSGSTSLSMGFNSRGLFLDPTTNVELLPNGQNGFLFTLINDRGRTYTVTVSLAGGISTQKL